MTVVSVVLRSSWRAWPQWQTHESDGLERYNSCPPPDDVKITKQGRVSVTAVVTRYIFCVLSISCPRELRKYGSWVFTTCFLQNKVSWTDKELSQASQNNVLSLDYMCSVASTSSNVVFSVEHERSSPSLFNLKTNRNPISENFAIYGT